MSYLVPSDYLKAIQSQNLDQLTGMNAANRINWELAMQAEVLSYLVPVYDVSNEFSDTLVYNPNSSAYTASTRVYLDAPLYSPNSSYAVGNLTLWSGNIYINTTLISLPGQPFTPGNWSLLGKQYQIFKGVSPVPVFSLERGTYKIGDSVIWKGIIYSALRPTSSTSHSAFIQAGTYDRLPYLNVFPDDPTSGAKFWQLTTTYQIPAGQILTTTYFVPGDNRNQLLISKVVDMVLYNLSGRISSINAPEIFKDKYRAAIRWLEAVSDGKVVLDMTKIQPVNINNNIRAGGNVKQNNSY